MSAKTIVAAIKYSKEVKDVVLMLDHVENIAEFYNDFTGDAIDAIKESYLIISTAEQALYKLKGADIKGVKGFDQDSIDTLLGMITPIMAELSDAMDEE